MSETQFIWVDHMEDMVRAIKALHEAHDALEKLNTDTLEGNFSDLTYDLPDYQIAATIDGLPTGWTVGYSEEFEAWGLVIDGHEEVGK